MIGYYLRAANPPPDRFIVSYLKKNKKLMATTFFGNVVINTLMTGLGAKKGALEGLQEKEWFKLEPLVSHLKLNMEIAREIENGGQFYLLSLKDIEPIPDTDEEIGEFLGMYPTRGWRNIFKERLAVGVDFYSAETGFLSIFTQVCADPVDENYVIDNAIALRERCQQAWDSTTGGLWGGVFNSYVRPLPPVRFLPRRDI